VADHIPMSWSLDLIRTVLFVQYVNSTLRITNPYLRKIWLPPDFPRKLLQLKSKTVCFIA
jgi:hypothetical protein